MHGQFRFRLKGLNNGRVGATCSFLDTDSGLVVTRFLMTLKLAYFLVILMASITRLNNITE